MRRLLKLPGLRLAALNLKPGMDVADVGAGTGFFSLMIAEKIGPDGTVHSVDIAKNFIEHIAKVSEEQGVKNIEAIVCTERSTNLAPESVDLVFVCDTYHHFEHPQATLASIRRALRPGGRLVVVDFVREPGSREWVLDHVRAGEEQTRAEIEAAGFRFEDRPDVPGLTENYVLRFRR